MRRRIDKHIFFSLVLINFIVALSLIGMVFELSGTLFFLELALLLLFILITLINIKELYNCKRKVWPLLIIFYCANLINLLGLYYIFGLGKVLLAAIFCLLGILFGYSEMNKHDMFCKSIVKQKDEKDVKIKTYKVNQDNKTANKSKTNKKKKVKKKKSFSSKKSKKSSRRKVKDLRLDPKKSLKRKVK